MREKDGKRIKYTKRLLWARYRARFFTFSNLILRTTLKEKNYYLFSIDEDIAASYIDDKWRNLPRSPIIFDFFPWSNWDSEMWSHLPKVAQWIRAGIQASSVASKYCKAKPKNQESEGRYIYTMTILFKYTSASNHCGKSTEGETLVFISQDRLSYAAEINKLWNLSGLT